MIWAAKKKAVQPFRDAVGLKACSVSADDGWPHVYVRSNHSKSPHVSVARDGRAFHGPPGQAHDTKV